MGRSQELKKFRETSLISYLEKNGVTFNSEIAKGEKVKLCSIDDFVDVIDEFEGKYSEQNAPMMISHVGGFYVTASLAGLSTNVCTTKPYILFFDRKHANVENALFNTLLMKSCEKKEECPCPEKVETKEECKCPKEKKAPKPKVKKAPKKAPKKKAPKKKPAKKKAPKKK